MKIGSHGDTYDADPPLEDSAADNNNGYLLFLENLSIIIETHFDIEQHHGPKMELRELHNADSQDFEDFISLQQGPGRCESRSRHAFIRCCWAFILPSHATPGSKVSQFLETLGKVVLVRSVPTSPPAYGAAQWAGWIW
ncbi:unnamed protein product [Lepeophtheirus salmonis]|uniref:(salmon louse) hypothetical protein n=1 Tax=Lepeophtheirus salmonis TaxID=72036 RepID=A0A7R8CLQ9_LEPSM|nr:unnamed protein product [Lepeophtheirus salmonis]CAF2858115.1 unnamed protein product [Lepeophtheirus salmonis]